MAESKIKKELTIEAETESIETVTRFAEELLDEYECPGKSQKQINIAIDELFGNICHYAYCPGSGFVTVQVEIVEEPRAAVITFVDHGIPYNPLEKEEPDVTSPAETRQIGGLGIYIAKKSMDDMSYEYRDGKNILKITKYF